MAPAPTLSRQEWLALRSQSIGSSDAAAACGESSTSPAELVLRKRGVMPDPDFTDIEAVGWGHLLQPAIVRRTAERSQVMLLDPVRDRKVIEEVITADGKTEVVGWLEDREVVVRSVEYPFMTATIDGIGVDEMTCSALIDIEAKNVGGYHSRDWDPENGQAPAKFDIQLAHQLAVAPAFQTGLLAGLIGGNSLRVLRRERVEIELTIEAIITLEAEIWRCVETGELPAYDGSESHIRALRALHPMDTGETIMLAPETLEWHEELQRLQADRQVRDKRIKVLRRNIEAALEGATFGALADGSGVYSNRHQHCREYTVQAADRPVLRFISAANWRGEKEYRGFE